jgi:hypothetical protein
MDHKDRIQGDRQIAAAAAAAVVVVNSNNGGGGSHREQGDLISLIPFFEKGKQVNRN